LPLPVSDQKRFLLCRNNTFPRISLPRQGVPQGLQRDHQSEHLASAFFPMASSKKGVCSNQLHRALGIDGAKKKQSQTARQSLTEQKRDTPVRMTPRPPTADAIFGKDRRAVSMAMIDIAGTRCLYGLSLFRDGAYRDLRTEEPE
jgi:hypothetical protein